MTLLVIAFYILNLFVRVIRHSRSARLSFASGRLLYSLLSETVFLKQAFGGKLSFR